MTRAAERLLRIAVLDSGIDPGHPGVRGRGTIAPAVRITTDGQPVDEQVPRDDLGHGTAVACAILALVPQATLLPVRVFRREPACSVLQLAAALRYAATLGAGLVNVSLGLTGWAARAELEAAVAVLLGNRIRVIAPLTAIGLPCLPGSLPGVDAVVADGNVPRSAPERRRYEDRDVWFSSPEPPPGIAGLPAGRIAGTSLAVANVTGFLAAQALGSGR